MSKTIIKLRVRRNQVTNIAEISTILKATLMLTLCQGRITNQVKDQWAIKLHIFPEAITTKNTRKRTLKMIPQKIHSNLLLTIKTLKVLCTITQLEGGPLKIRILVQRFANMTACVTSI